MNGADRKHAGVDCIDSAAMDRLQHVDALRCGHKRVGARLRHRSVRLLTLNVDIYGIDTRQKRPDRKTNLARVNQWRDVKGEDGQRCRVLERALFDHHLRAKAFHPAYPFLRWLKNQLHRPGNLRLDFAQYLGQAQRHRDVRIVPAGMLDALGQAFVSHSKIRFVDGQRIDIGAPRNHRPRLVPSQHPHNSVASDARFHLVEPKRAQALCN